MALANFSFTVAGQRWTCTKLSPLPLLADLHQNRPDWIILPLSAWLILVSSGKVARELDVALSSNRQCLVNLSLADEFVQ
jgi:hypothetical protein